MEEMLGCKEVKERWKIDISKEKRYDIYLKWREGKRGSMQE